jgi:hypothetical protein
MPAGLGDADPDCAPRTGKAAGPVHGGHRRRCSETARCPALKRTPFSAAIHSRNRPCTDSQYPPCEQDWSVHFSPSAGAITSATISSNPSKPEGINRRAGGPKSAILLGQLNDAMSDHVLRSGQSSEVSHLRTTAAWTFYAIGLFAGFVGVVGFYDTLVSGGLTGGLRKLIDGYRHLVLDPLGRLLDPLLGALLQEISRWLKVEWHLPPHWKDLFVPAWFYFLKDAGVNWRKDRKNYSVFLAVSGTIVALLFAIGLGNIEVNANPLISLMSYIPHSNGDKLRKVRC